MFSMNDYSVSDVSQTPTKKGFASTLTRPRRVWRLYVFEDILQKFSPAERLALYILAIFLTLSTLSLMIQLNNKVSILVPSQGGTLIEGEVGPARFINPVLTLSQPDQDLTTLIYSGLTRMLPDGSIVPDIAASYQISVDGTTYTFTLRSDATFQDGTAITAPDVLYTVAAAQNPNLNSPQRANWQGVVVSSPDAHTVVFTLPHAYAPFIQDTTLGILPKHLWQKVSDEEFPFSPLNTHPIGSGPYKIRTVSTDSTGSATRYDLVPFRQFAHGQTYLDTLTFLFYPDDASMEKALNEHKIDAVAGIASGDLSRITRTDVNIIKAPLPRVFGIFFNQAHNTILSDSSVRAALNASVDKQAIVHNILNGYGVALDGPIPPEVLGVIQPSTPSQFVPTLATQKATSTAPTVDSTSLASTTRTILTNGGWVWNPSDSAWEKSKQQLSLSLATGDEPELVATANAVAASWRALGVRVSVQIYPLSELNTNVIRPRNYDAVLFGEVVGREADLFAFWHSSQRNDPGLNLAMYANSTTDKLLSQARTTSDQVSRDALYQQFNTIIEKDQPAIFLYAPEFIYIVPKSLEGVQLGALTTPSDRFADVYDWYTELERVWTVFADKAHQ